MTDFEQLVDDAPLSSTTKKTVGAMLREAREELDLSYRDLSAITKIQAAQLGYLEDDRFDEFPADVYTRGFLRICARELRLDADEVVARFDEQTGRPAESVAVVDLDEATSEAAIARDESSRFAARSRFGQASYIVALALLVFGLALAVLVVTSGDSDEASSASFHAEDYADGWMPVPQEQLDWQTVREN